MSIKGFIHEIKSLPENIIPDDFKLKLQSFIEIMLQRGITGNEFVQTLDGMCKSKFFGTEVEKAYLWRRFEQSGKKHSKRMVLLRQNIEDKQEAPPLYLIDTTTLGISEPTSQQLIEQLNDGSIVYESEKHKIPGIDKEENDDTLNEIRIMNDTMINYLKKLGINAKKNETIKKYLKMMPVFFKMNKTDAILILNEVGIKENIEEIYSNLISHDTFYDLYNNKKIDDADPELVIKYKIFNYDNLFSKNNRINNNSETQEISLIENKKFNFWNDLFNKLKRLFGKK